MSRSLLADIKHQPIVSRAVEFLSRDDILSGKELLLLKSGLPDPFRKSLKDDENVLDIAKFFVKSAKKNRALPTFVIFEPTEVPACMEEINACITTKVNDMCRRFDGFIERFNKGEFHVSAHTSPSSELYSPQKLSYSVVVKNPPPLKTPLERKNFIESACGEALDATKVELRPGRNGWRMAVAHKATAEKIALAIKNKNSESDAKVKTPLYIGLIKGIPEPLDAEVIQSLVSGCEKAEQCGKSRAFKLYFPSRESLNTATKLSMKVGFESFRIQEFVFLPKRCYNCHESGHIAAQCKNVSKCAHCAQNNHGATKENPCQNAMRCLSCTSTRHTCYHASCPSNKSAKLMTSNAQNE